MHGCETHRFEGMTVTAVVTDELESVAKISPSSSENPVGVREGLECRSQRPLLLLNRPLNFSQFSHSVVSNSLQPHGLQHSRPTCPSPTPRACSNSCPSSRDTIQPSHPLSTPSPPAFNLSQHQGLCQ